jgi:uncharacterized protein (TIGR00369 family)
MTIGTARLDRMIAAQHQRSPAGMAMSLPVMSEYRPGYVRSVHRIDPKFTNAGGVIFGGYIAALLDDVSGYVTDTVIADDKVCATAELSVSFFRPCMSDAGEFTFEGFLINESRRSYHVEVTLARSDGKLIAKARAIYAISERRGA